MIEEITKSIKAELYERVTSPLLGAFLVSWPVWNYKAVLTFLSGMTPLEKIKMLEDQLYPSYWEGIGFLFALPLISALVYLFLYPFPAKFVYRRSRLNQKELKKIKVTIEDETPVTLSEHNQLRRKISELESDYYSSLASKDAEIVRLRAMSIESPSKPVASRSNKQGPQEPAGVPDVSGPHPIITSITVAGEKYVLGTDYDKDKPGQVNVIKLRTTHVFSEKIPVSIETSIPLVNGKTFKVFDGHKLFSPDEPQFELQKTDYEDKNAFVVVEQPNPLRDGKPIVISNKVQFAY